MSNDAYISDDDRPDESDADMAECIAWHEQQQAFPAYKRAGYAEMMRTSADDRRKAMREECPF